MSTTRKNVSEHLQNEDLDSKNIVEEVISKAENKSRKFIKGRLLGKGGFARCYEFTNVETKAICAAKIISKASLSKHRAKQKLLTEIKIHKSLHHQHIVNFEHYFEDHENVYILLEICNNETMNELLKRRKRLTELEVQCYLIQMLSVLTHLHKSKVIHRDLKLGNLFLSDNMEIKLGDFGLAARIDFEGERKRTICGTPNYIAPEILEDKNGHSYEVDIWSLGVIIYTFLIGKPPFETNDVKSTYRKIRMGNYSFPEHIPISPYARNLIESLLVNKPEKRLTLDEIRAHSFLRNSQNVPKLMPISTLACPPSSTFLKQFGFSHDKEDSYRGNRLENTTPNLTNTNGLRFGLKEKKDFTNTERVLSVDVNNNALAIMTTQNTGEKARIFEKAPLFTTEKNLAIEKSPLFADKPGFGDCFGERKNEKMVFTEEKQKALEKVGFPGSNIESLANRIFKKKTPNTYTTNTENSRERGPSCELKLRANKQSFNGESGHNLSNYLNEELAVPTVWVKKWVDYSSKYGLGYLLSNGASGAYFNDATKILAEGNLTDSAFNYIERNPSTRVDLIQEHRFDEYPKEIQKKVVLLQHFKRYLEGDNMGDIGRRNDLNLQQTGAISSKTRKINLASCNEEKEKGPLVYVKKWMRNKHAIMFRFNNKLVQVIFQDQTEVLLSSELKVAVYVNKKQERTSFPLATAFENKNPEISKRLRYAKEILNQMLGEREELKPKNLNLNNNNENNGKKEENFGLGKNNLMPSSTTNKTAKNLSNEGILGNVRKDNYMSYENTNMLVRSQNNLGRMTGGFGINYAK